MSWREPRHPRELVPGDCASLRELAIAYHPFIRFADAERFFPALAEAWLGHASSAPWPSPGEDVDPAPVETGLDPQRRGTAVCHANDDVSAVERRGGAPNPDDRPLDLDPLATGRDAITSYHGVGGDHFLDFGGWTADVGEPFRGRRGDLEYLRRSFSELAAAMQPNAAWEPVELMAHLPAFWVRQPPTPTVYCEARRAMDFVRASERLERSDFPPLPAGNPLERILVLTYHYLYPAREPSDGEPAVRAKEGQWEAASLFFELVGEGDELRFHEPPLAVVVSQGTDAPGPRPHATDHRSWTDVATAAGTAHPILFVARGTHRFFFEAQGGQSWIAGPGGGPTVPDGGSYDQNSEMPGMESALVAALLVAALLALTALAVAAMILALLLLLLWLVSLIADLCNDDAENPAHPMPTNPEAQGTGPQGGDETGPPAPGTSDGSGVSAEDGNPDVPAVYGLPNTGSPTGEDTVSFDVRFVDRSTRGGDRPERRARSTAYPSPEPCENPTWWDYSGRWGVRVTPSLGGTWASGDRRVDEHGRSWGYWHTLRFFEERHLAGG